MADNAFVDPVVDAAPRLLVMRYSEQRKVAHVALESWSGMGMVCALMSGCRYLVRELPQECTCDLVPKKWVAMAGTSSDYVFHVDHIPNTVSAGSDKGAVVV